MPDTKDIPPNTRFEVIKQLPLFEHCDDKLLKAFVEIFTAVDYEQGSCIVRENESIDAVYVILSGEAEVSVQNLKSKPSQIEFLAVLRQGESIGLDDTGFYSKTGVRTATVTAIKPVCALKLGIEEFKNFLDAHPSFIPDIKSTTDLLLRHHFIKSLQPFEKLSAKKVQSVCENIIELEIPANTTLITQGDDADACYYLISGEAEVIFKSANGQENVTSTLTDGTLFGELALIIEAKRNASIITRKQSKLLKITRPVFKELILAASIEDFDTITNMIMDRHRPERCEGITIHQRKNAENETVIILKNADKGTYFRLSKESLFIWNLLDGEHNLQEITVDYFFEYNQLVTDTIGNLILNLMQSGFVKMPALSTYIEQPKLPIWMRGLSAFRRALTYEYSIKNVDAWLTWHYNLWGWIFFTKIALFAMGCIAFFGFFLFAAFLHNAEAIIKVTPNAWLLLLLMGPANLLTIPIHEFAHAFTTKSYGHQVHRLGVGWFWLGPIAFADTSDMWLATRGKRIAVNLAGIYINVVLSGILTVLAWIIPNPTIAVFMWMVAFSSYMLAFYNLDPIFELDGYYVLMDAVDKPNLRKAATIWLLNDVKKTFTSFKLLKKYRAEVSYWLFCCCFICMATFIAYIAQTYVLNAMLPTEIGHVKPQNFRWVFSAIVITVSFASLYGMVKQEAKHQYGKIN